MIQVDFEIDPAEISKEDGGQALIYTIVAENVPELFFRLQSWDESKEMKHTEFNKLLGKKLRITIEEL
jgi:hypothetical protein